MPTTATIAPSPETLHHVLGDLRFPALRWELIVTADLYGIDEHTRAALAALPARQYRDVEHVATAIARLQLPSPGSRLHLATSYPCTRSPMPEGPRRGDRLRRVSGPRP
jgi:hypothetical protein